MTDSEFFALLPPPQDPLSELYHNPSLLNADEFEAALHTLPDWQNSPHARIPSQIRNGFDLGIEGAVVESYFPENLKVTAAQIPSIDKSVIEDASRRGLAGPYNPGALVQQTGMKWRSNPLGAVHKYTPPGEPEKHRAIEHLSYPRNAKPGDRIQSVNSLLRASDFPSRWTPLRTLLDALRRLPPSATIAIGDLERAFKQLSLVWWQRPHHGILWRGKYFFRKTPSFGGRTTPGVFGGFVDFLLDLLEAEFPGLFTSNIVDDLLMARFGDEVVSLERLLAFFAKLGVILSKEKMQAFSKRFLYGGVWIDLTDLTVELDGRKRDKYARKIRDFLDGGTKTLDETVSLMGSLLYVTEIVPLRRTFLHSLLAFRRGYPKERPNVLHHVPRSLRKELIDWLTFLTGPEPIKSSFALPPTLSKVKIFTDACPAGLGLVVNDMFYAYYPLSPIWSAYANKSGNISAAEAWAVEMVGSVVDACDIKEKGLIIGVDNTNVVQSWSKGRASNIYVNKAIRRLQRKVAERGVVFFLRYVKSEDNPADSVSRNEIASHLVPFPFLFPPPPGTEGGPPP